MALAHLCPLIQCLHMYDASGVVTRSFLPLHGLQLLPSPKATQYFIVQTHGRATGQDRGTGGRTMDTLGFVLFFKEKYSLFQAYGN